MDPTELAQILGHGAPPPVSDEGDYSSLLYPAIDHGQSGPAPLDTRNDNGDTTGLSIQPLNDSGMPGTPVTSPNDPREDTGGAPNATATVEPSFPVGSIGAKAGTSYSGFSPQSYNAIQKGPKTRLEKEEAQDEATVAQEYAGEGPALQKSAEEQRQALEHEGQVEKAKGEAVAKAHMAIADANTDFMNKEQAATQNAQAESQHFFNQYKAAQAEYAAMQPNPAQLWEAAGAQGQFNMTMVAFAHDFLGAKGIKTSGMEAWKDAANRNMEAQLENMRHKRDVAQGFKEMWDMQRAQSATDAEARARMRGFYLQSLDQGLQATLAGYDSQLAQAKLEEARAKVSQEMVKNDLEVKQHMDAAAAQRRNARVNVYQADVSASNARVAADASIQVAKIHAAAQQVKNAPRFIIDPETNKGKWVLKQGLSDKEKEKASESAVNLENFTNSIRELEEFARSHKPILDPLSGGFLARFNDEDARTAQGLVKQLAHNLVHANGEKATDADVKDFEQEFPLETVLTNGGVEKILASTKKRNIDATRSIVRQYGEDVPENQQPNGPDVTGLMAGNYAEAQAVKAGGNKHDTTGNEKLIQEVKAPYASTTVDTEPDETMRSHWQDFKASDEGKKLPTSPYWSQASRGNPSQPDPYPYKSFEALDKLAEAAISGDADALAKLQEMASGKSQHGFEYGDSGPPKVTSERNATEMMAYWELMNRVQPVINNPATK